MAVKKVSIGEMRQVGKFIVNTDKQLYTAGYVDGYEDGVISVYCKLRKKNGTRTDEFGEVQLTSTWEMQCRFQSAIDNIIDDSAKFVQGGRTFTIVGFEVVDERGYQYYFTLNLKDK